MSDSRPIRVAQIMGKLWAGGVEAVVFNYYREIDKTKIQFDFYYDSDSTVEPPQELIDMGARFIKIPPYQKLPIYLQSLKRHFKENHYEIVHSHINTLSVFPLYAAWREGVPVRIAHNHSVPGGKEFKRNILKYLLRYFSKIFPTDYFACSEKAGRWMFGDKDFDNDKVFILNNAIDFDKFKINSIESQELKKKLKLENKFVIGHVGRFTFAKNHSFLLDVFREICKKRENAVLLLVGDGELHNKIVAKIQDMGIENRVILIGKVSNPEKYYGLIDVMVLPSVFEGLSMTVVESQVAGIPAVISKAIPEEAIISNGCQYHRISESPLEWATAAMKMENMQVNIDERSEKYDIRKQQKKLTDWYLEYFT